MANFGFSLGDIVLVCNYAYSVYKSSKHAGEDFRSITSDVKSLQAYLINLNDEFENPASLIHRTSPTQRSELNVLLQNCRSDLDELKKLLQKYRSLKTSQPRARDMLTFTANKQAGIKSRITAHIDRLTLFLNGLHTGSLARIESINESHIRAFEEIKSKLDVIHEDVLMGKRDPSIFADLDGQIALEQELLDDNVTEVDVELNRDHIALWLEQLRHESDVKGILQDISLREPDTGDDESCIFSDAPYKTFKRSETIYESREIPLSVPISSQQVIGTDDADESSYSDASSDASYATAVNVAEQEEKCNNDGDLCEVLGSSETKRNPLSENKSADEEGYDGSCSESSSEDSSQISVDATPKSVAKTGDKFETDSRERVEAEVVRLNITNHIGQPLPDPKEKKQQPKSNFLRQPPGSFSQLLEAVPFEGLPKFATSKDFKNSVQERCLFVSLEQLYTGTIKAVVLKRFAYDSNTAQYYVEHWYLEVWIPRHTPEDPVIEWVGLGNQSADWRQDLWIRIKAKLDPFCFEQEESLEYEVRITLFEALYGWERLIRTFDGLVYEVSCPGPTNPAHECILKELEKSTAGPLRRRKPTRLMITVEYPTTLTARQKKSIGTALKHSKSGIEVKMLPSFYFSQTEGSNDNNKENNTNTIKAFSWNPSHPHFGSWREGSYFT